MLCGLLNSFVANYLVRLQTGMHVTASLMARLQVPRPARSHPAFMAIAGAVRRLRDSVDDAAARASLQAWAARLYGLSASELGHVLSGFRLSRADEGPAILAAFHGIVS